MLSDSKSKELLYYLKLPRYIEERMLLLLRQGKISKWFSGIGQEAISVGTAYALEKDDYILPMHRNLGVFTTRNVSLDRLFCQLFGKQDGFTNGRDRTGLEVNDWIKKCESLGAGEVMITSIDKEGTGKGPDLELIDYLQDSIKLPIIYSGGVGSIKDIKNLNKFRIDALALSRVLHYDLLKVKEIKDAIK